MSRFGLSLMCVFGFVVGLLAAPAGAQESLDRGKSGAQLFASDCVICHKSSAGLSKGRLLGLESFLREHYTASRESAAAVAAYIQATDKGPAAPAAGKPAKRNAKGDKKGDEKKPETGKAGDAKPTEAKPTEAKPMDTKPVEAKPAEEPKPAAPKPDDAKPSEPRPAQSPKSD